MATTTEQLLTDFRAELNKLMPAVGLVDEMSAYVILVRGKADAIQKETERILKDAENLSKKNMEDSKKKLEDFSNQAQQDLQAMIQSLSGLMGELTRLTELLKNVDVPGRFERAEIRLDNLNTGIQNLYGRLDALERTIRDENARIKELTEELQRKVGGVKTLVVVFGVVQVLLMVGFFVVLYLRGR